MKEDARTDRSQSKVLAKAITRSRELRLCAPDYVTVLRQIIFLSDVITSVRARTEEESAPYEWFALKELGIWCYLAYEEVDNEQFLLQAEKCFAAATRAFCSRVDGHHPVAHVPFSRADGRHPSTRASSPYADGRHPSTRASFLCVDGQHPSTRASSSCVDGRHSSIQLSFDSELNTYYALALWAKIQWYGAPWDDQVRCAELLERCVQDASASLSGEVWFRLGVVYEKGIGCKPNTQRAQRCFDHARQYGLKIS